MRIPMKILIANLGSTSFKYRLFDMEADNAAQLASGVCGEPAPLP